MGTVDILNIVAVVETVGILDIVHTVDNSMKGFHVSGLEHPRHDMCKAWNIPGWHIPVWNVPFMAYRNIEYAIMAHPNM